MNINEFPEFDNFLIFQNKIAELTSEVKNLTELNIKLSSEISLAKTTNSVLVDAHLKLNNKYSNQRIVLVTCAVLSTFLLLSYFNLKRSLQSRDEDKTKSK
jgi:hypothetical protein